MGINGIIQWNVLDLDFGLSMAITEELNYHNGLV